MDSSDRQYYNILWQRIVLLSCWALTYCQKQLTLIHDISSEISLDATSKLVQMQPSSIHASISLDFASWLVQKQFVLIHTWISRDVISKLS